MHSRAFALTGPLVGPSLLVTFPLPLPLPLRPVGPSPLETFPRPAHEITHFEILIRPALNFFCLQSKVLSKNADFLTFVDVANS